jgi:hypothetical protein
MTAGNQCRNILHQLDELEEELQGQYPQWLAAFRSFLRMTKACYGRNLSDNYVETIADFQDKYLNLGINVTPKVILKQMLHHFQRSSTRKLPMIFIFRIKFDRKLEFVTL